MKRRVTAALFLTVGLLLLVPVFRTNADDRDKEPTEKKDDGFNRVPEVGVSINLNNIFKKKPTPTPTPAPKPKASHPAPEPTEARQAPPPDSCITKLTIKNDDDHPITYEVYSVPATKDEQPVLLAKSPEPVPPDGSVTLTPEPPQTMFGKEVTIKQVDIKAKIVGIDDVDGGKIHNRETGIKFIEVETQLCDKTATIPLTGSNVTPTPTPSSGNTTTPSPGGTVPSTTTTPFPHTVDKDDIPKVNDKIPWSLLEYLIPLALLIGLIEVLRRLFNPPNYTDTVLKDTPRDDGNPPGDGYDDPSSYDPSSYYDPSGGETPDPEPNDPDFVPYIPGFLPRYDEDPCYELIRLCNEAKARAKAAADAAKAAADAAKAAQDACAKAQAAVAAAQAELDKAMAPVDEGSSWIEDDQGHRITSHDLDLESQAAAAARAKYASGDITAQELEDQLSQWGPEQGPAAMAARRAKEAADRAKKIADAQAKLDAAKKAQDEICSKVGPAVDNAAEMEDEADDAMEEADEICGEAADCIEKRDAPPPAMPKTQSKPDPKPPTGPDPGGGSTDPGPHTTDGGTGGGTKPPGPGGGGGLPPQPPPYKPPPPPPIVACCGKEVDDLFVDCLNRTLMRLIKVCPPGIERGPRIAMGLMFLERNGVTIDFLGDWDCPENKLKGCFSSMTLGNKCHPYHILSDFLYGFVAGYFGLTEIGASLGGFYFKLRQYYQEGYGEHPASPGKPSTPFPPAHLNEAQPAYRAGARLGGEVYGTLLPIVTKGDLYTDMFGTPLADIAVIPTEKCHPCPEKAKESDIYNDFSRKEWEVPYDPFPFGKGEIPGPGSKG